MEFSMKYYKSYVAALSDVAPRIITRDIAETITMWCYLHDIVERCEQYMEDFASNRDKLELMGQKRIAVNALRNRITGKHSIYHSNALFDHFRMIGLREFGISGRRVLFERFQQAIYAGYAETNADVRRIASFSCTIYDDTAQAILERRATAVEDRFSDILRKIETIVDMYCTSFAATVGTSRILLRDIDMYAMNSESYKSIYAFPAFTAFIEQTGKKNIDNAILWARGNKSRSDCAFAVYLRDLIRWRFQLLKTQRR